ncbi:methylated-DNA--[protein]-cysteine S-methyltransferase [Kocuria sp. JC486]|uniref:methylated-DNA--[protein]-cysteine S-methyltransferase n=1 Tax=Kocuria sp. JC486 TaxID=1970736 RepID=UPI001FD833AD|nr:methylated-DNA--[protein]-cysteine S-methyltransferase [Kocuria sp. JC486]
MSDMNPTESGQGAVRPSADDDPLRTDSVHLPAPVESRHRLVPTPLGDMVLAVGDFDGGPAVTGAWFAGQKHFPDAVVLGTADDGQDPLLSRAAEQLKEWFAGERRDFDLPLALDSKPQGLRPRVWQALRDVAFGQTTTYGELALQLGGAGLAQAVGQAVGRNPWSVIVPCHRVLGADGGLTGYAGGLERKRSLLEFEGSLPRTPGLF